MNERMYELINQCFIGTTDGKLSDLNTVANIEKFAELIVRECVGVVSKRKNQAIDDGWNVDEAMTMAEMDLEEHFGVEK